MKEEDIDRLHKGRSIIDRHRKRDRTEEIAEKAIGCHTKQSTTVWLMLADLKDVGFQTVDEFRVWNHAMNLEAFKDCLPIEGECDLCPGVPTDQFSCCYYDAKEQPKGVPDPIVEWSLQQYQLGNHYEAKGGILKVRGGCPVDHGFYIITDKVKGLPFDITWRM